eukprot:3028481-Amphidinium_carterae.1
MPSVCRLSWLDDPEPENLSGVGSESPSVLCPMLCPIMDGAAVEAALGATPRGVQVSWGVPTMPPVSEPGDAPGSPTVTGGCGEAGA